MSEPASRVVKPAAPKAARWKSAVRVVVALGLLAVVAWMVPWHDTLLLKSAGKKFEAPGAIEGNWRADAIEFHFAAEAQLGPEWPEDVRAAAAARRALHVVRDAEEEERPTGKASLGWQPGMLRIFGELDPIGLVVALALFVAAASTGVTRWWRLLALAGCPTTWWNVFRLTFLGFFFNLVMPGLTGGDVIKAVLVVREHPRRRADALMSVIVDRGLGLLVLVGLAVVAVWFSGAHFQELQLVVTLSFGAALAGLFLVLHPLPRRLLRVENIVARLPQRERIQKLDAALRLYAHHPLEMGVAVVLSAMNHALIAGGVFALGRAFGEYALSPLEYIGVVALANVISSIPLAPGGWGLGEVVFGKLFHILGASSTLGIAVSITYRLLITAMNFGGGVFLLLPGGRGLRAEGEELAAREDEAAAR